MSVGATKDTMGVYATVYVDPEVDLPHFPEGVERDVFGWMSKQGLDPYSGPYRITSDGRLEKEQTTKREKTEQEKQEEAENWGFESWKEYVNSYERMDKGNMFPEEIDVDTHDEYPPTIFPREETEDETWWGDCNMHGTFEFHKMIELEDDVKGVVFSDEVPEETDLYLQYEARYTKGSLDDIVFIGERMGERSRKETIDVIEKWNKSTL